jgi:hypothetical protein
VCTALWDAPRLIVLCYVPASRILSVGNLATYRRVLVVATANLRRVIIAPTPGNTREKQGKVVPVFN